MGFKSISTRRTSATSAVSNQAVVINTGTGNLSVGGSKINDSTSITLGVTTPGQSSANSSVAAQGGPVISSVIYLDANNNPTSANAVGTSGGNIRITGTGFVTGSSVYINNTLVSNTFVSSTQITAVCPAASAGNVSILLFTPTDVGTQKANAVRYSGAPTWVTSAVSLVNGALANVALSASSDSTLTYTLQAGSTLPTGISLQSTGYLTGTPTGYSGTTAVTVVIVATDQESQATQQTINITIASGDDYFKYTTLLLNGDTGTNVVNNATNNVFVDSSANNLTITRAGNATQGTFSPFSPTGWSNYFSATNAYSTVSMGDTQAFGTGDFTVECWVNMLAQTAINISMAATSTTTWELLTYGSQLYWHENGGNLGGTGYGTVPSNTWVHLAVSRASGVLKMFVNGVQVYSAANTYNYSNTTTVRSIGPYNGGTAPYYLSNFRVIKGTGLYTSNFTPSITPLTAVANTQLLTCQSNRFIDNSSNNFTLTNTGAISVQAVSPFAPTSAYSASTNGGSAYFDGTGDKLTIANYPSLAFGANAFTIQCWFYTNVASTEQVIATNGWASYAPWLIRINSSNQAMLNMSLNGGSWYVSEAAFGTVVPSQWYHVAVTRSSGGTLRAFLNGVQGYTTELSTSALYNGSQALNIGGRSDTSVPFNGYISGAQLINGTALYTSNFTLPTTPPTATSGTTLLCNFTNGSIIDAHSTNVLETVGDAKLSTSVTKFGTASMAFDSTGDYLSAPYNQLYGLETGDFTIECWVYRNVSGAEHNVAVTRSSSGQDGWNVRINSNNTLQFYFTGGSSLTSTGTIPATTWTHIAVTKSGNTVRLFINGTIDGSNAAFGTGTANTQPLRIGVDNSNTAGYMNGYIDDLRITKGFARYTANFTPPTSAFQGQ